jgi:tetratricopeptide (TPR) repeat protein
MPVNFHFTLDAEDNKTAARAQLEDQVAASKSALSEASVLKASSASKQELIEKLMETATLEQRLGDFKNAGNDFAKAAHLAEARPVQKNLLLALYGEGECRKLSGDYGAAQQALTRALDVAVNGLNMPDREIVDLLDLYAKVLYKESKHDEARKIEARIEEAKNLGTKF